MSVPLIMVGEDDFEVERLRAELAQEKQMKDMLEQSLGELKLTVEEMDKRIEGVDEESNEWKTRYETQYEMNQQMEKQLLMFHSRVDEAKRDLKDAGKPSQFRIGDLDGLSEVTPQMIKTMEKEKVLLENQLRDLEWRLDQESKAYHKANEERKQYITEINTTKYTMQDISARNIKTPRENIPSDQRILDPKRGPIRKTAAVKNLPRL